MGGVVGIGFVPFEQLWLLARQQRFNTNCSAEELCKRDEVRSFCLGELRRHASDLGFEESEQPRAFRLELQPFSQERDLQTTMLQLRRDRLHRRFATEIDELYEELRNSKTRASTLDLSVFESMPPPRYAISRSQSEGMLFSTQVHTEPCKCD